jgi:hypothetical protein
MSTPLAQDPPPRIQSFQDFWPYYLSEHNDPRCRQVHFIGTTGFVGYLAYLISLDDLLGVALFAALVIGWLSFRYEAKQNAFWALLGMIGAMTAANPEVLYGVLFAYFWAWVGHFLIEHNRPATFSYPLWSLAGDFRMWAEMCIGRRWRGSSEVER